MHKVLFEWRTRRFFIGIAGEVVEELLPLRSKKPYHNRMNISSKSRELQKYSENDPERYVLDCTSMIGIA